MDCVFCKIANNEIPSFKIYEDDLILAFLDASPAAEGHTLIIPKRHFENIFDIENNYLNKIISTAKIIAEKMKSDLGVEGVNIYHASGKAAEQSVFHFHLHIIPRVPDDTIDFTGATNKNIKKLNPEEMEEIRKKLT
ncbi:MAG: HIT family protein, partial [Candidatus Paceibacterota bacterium]